MTKRSAGVTKMLLGLWMTGVLLATAVNGQTTTPVLEISGSISNPRPVTGETVRVDVELINHGPPSIRNVWTEINVKGGLVTRANCMEGPSTPFEETGVCVFSQLATNQKVNYSFDVQVGNSASVLSITGFVSIYTIGTSAAPPLFSIDVPVTSAESVADLALAVPDSNPFPMDAPITFETSITNHGPNDASDVTLLARDPWGRPLADVTGATCETDALLVICRIPTLRAGATVTVRYSRGSWPYASQNPRTVSVIAGRSFDPDEANSSLTQSIITGLPAELTRVLLPLVAPPTDGAFGSQWISEVSTYVDADAPLFLFPTRFECPILCEAAALSGTWVDPRGIRSLQLLTSREFPGQLLRFDRSRTGEVALTARIRDTSRRLDTWGTAVPVVTDQELVRGRLQLIDVAAGARFRQTLRIYEPDATGATVHVRIWADTYPETFIGEKTLVLTTPPDNVRPDKNAGLPLFPAQARLDLATEFPKVDQHQQLRIELEAASPAIRYWAFVSITNNETQHVTLVVPGEREND